MLRITFQASSGGMQGTTNGLSATAPGTIFARHIRSCEIGRRIEPAKSRVFRQMGKVIVFVPKSDHDRKARLMREARAIYESIFPTSVVHPDEADGVRPERVK